MVTWKDKKNQSRIFSKEAVDKLKAKVSKEKAVISHVDKKHKKKMRRHYMI